MSNHIVLQLQAQTAISHGDPGAQDDSNATPFRTQDVLYTRSDTPVADDIDAIGEEPETLRTRNLQEAEGAITEVARCYPLPSSSYLAIALQQLKAEEFVASAFVYSLICQLNKLHGGEGEGLFSGMGRYDMLLKRLAIVSYQFQTSFFTLYSSLLRELNITSSLSGFTDLLWRYCTLPRSVQQAVIATLGKDRQAVVTIARAWFKELPEEEARKQEGMFSEYYNPSGKVASSSMTKVEASVPWISSNAFRHSVFRETLCNHLLATLGLGSMEEVNANRLVPPYVAMLLWNAGNVRGKAVVPENSNAIDYSIKRLFPSVDLLGACTPTHIMDGCLSVADWTLCMQNNEFTRTVGSGYTSDVDASSLLSIQSNTRHTPPGMETTKDTGQMIFSHTVMKLGSEVLLSTGYTLPARFVSRLAHGAAYFALCTWLASGGQVGGHDGAGEGRFQLHSIEFPEAGFDEEFYVSCAEEYQTYIEENKQGLHEALVSGSLGYKERLKTW